MVCLGAGTPAAFAIARLEFPGRRALLGIALAISMFPPIATVSPLYLALSAVGLRDTLIGLVLPYATSALPLSLWVLTAAFEALPDELYRAARIDGCTPFQALRRVLLPLAWPALATCTLLIVIFSWNELLYALTFLSSPGKRTIPVAITLFGGEHREPWAEIADGEFLALVAPSGCGKSTTLNLIAGLDAPTSGTVLIDGRDVTAASPGERDIAMVFQSYALYPHLDVRGNIAFPLQVARRPRAEIERRVREAAAMLGLGELLERKPRELSGGQRQRVALGRALVREPKVFLFDEPLSNLDAGLRLQLRAELKLLHERLRATFIYVTHDQSEAMTLASRIVVTLPATASASSATAMKRSSLPSFRQMWVKPRKLNVFGFPCPRFSGVSAAKRRIAGVFLQMSGFVGHDFMIAPAMGRPSGWEGGPRWTATGIPSTVPSCSWILSFARWSRRSSKRSILFRSSFLVRARAGPPGATRMWTSSSSRMSPSAPGAAAGER